MQNSKQWQNLDLDRKNHTHSLVKAKKKAGEVKLCVDYARQRITHSGFAMKSSKKAPQNTGMWQNILPHAIIEVVIVLTADVVASTVAKRVTIGFCTQIAAEDTKEKIETTVAHLMTNTQHCLARRGAENNHRAFTHNNNANITKGSSLCSFAHNSSGCKERTKAVGD